MTNHWSRVVEKLYHKTCVAKTASSCCHMWLTVVMALPQWARNVAVCRIIVGVMIAFHTSRQRQFVQPLSKRRARGGRTSTTRRRHSRLTRALPGVHVVPAAVPAVRQPVTAAILSRTLLPVHLFLAHWTHLSGGDFEPGVPAAPAASRGTPGTAPRIPAAVGFPGDAGTAARGRTAPASAQELAGLLPLRPRGLPRARAVYCTPVAATATEDVVHF